MSAKVSDLLSARMFDYTMNKGWCLLRFCMVYAVYPVGFHCIIVRNELTSMR